MYPRWLLLRVGGILLVGSARAIFEALAALYKPRRYVRFTTTYNLIDPQSGGHIKEFLGPAIEVPPNQLERWANAYVRSN